MDRRRILLIVAVIVAVLGAGLVFLYAQGADDRAADKNATVEVLVATQEIRPGESASDAADAGKLLKKAVPQDDVVAGSTNDGTVFADKVALTTIYPGEQLITAKFGQAGEIEGQQLLPLPKGKIAVQIAMSDAGKVGAFTRPGSHVVIFVVPKSETSTDEDGSTVLNVTPAKVLLPDVLVLAVGSVTLQPVTDADGNVLESTPLTNLTLALDQKEAEVIIGAGSGASGGTTLYFGLRNDASDITSDLLRNKRNATNG